MVHGNDSNFHEAQSRAPRLPLGAGLWSVVHLLSDMHQGMLPVILLYQREALGLSLSQVGLAAGLYNLVISLAQPLFGHLVDRFGERRIAVGGAVWVALLGGTLGLAPAFGMLILLAGLAALGPAAFHPSGAVGVGRLAASKQGLNMSVFFVGGTLGHALGAFLAATVFDITGLHGTVWIALGILIAALGLLAKMPFAQPSATSASHLALRERRAPLTSLRRILLGGAAALLVVTGVRTWLQLSLATYVPQQLSALGFAPSRASQGLSLMQAAVALGVLVGGPLIDRFGPRGLATCTLVALAPVLILFARSTTLSMGLLLGLAGLLVGIPLSMTFVVGQSFLPQSRGLASGLLFATSSAAGAAGVALTGFLADGYGLAAALSAMGVLSLLAAVAGLALPTDGPGAPAEAITVNLKER